MFWNTLYLYLKIAYKKYFPFTKSNFSHPRDIGEVFKEIYLKNYWGSATTLSGPGSELAVTKKFIPQLNELFNQYNVKNILDCPCGDFNWMKYVNLKDRKYLGADIVKELVEVNIQKYKTSEIDFKILDITNDNLPFADLILCRDGLVHFSYEEIFKALKQIKQSGSKYLLTTTFNMFPANFNINTGEWRPINFLKKPFYFPDPIFTINEYLPSDIPKQYTKSLTLWKIDSLRIPEYYRN